MTCGGNQEVRRTAVLANGFSIMELLVTVAILLIAAAITAPIVSSAVANYQFKNSLSITTGAIKSTRYQAIDTGFPWRLVFDSTAMTYQAQENTTDPSGATGTFNNVKTAVPLAGASYKPALSASITLQFSPSGAVKIVTSPGGTTTVSSCGAVPAPCSFTLSYKGNTEAITVSAYGNVSVTP
jgi:prepilin-type N-terminal cleavage/methylation domain-containing protein